MDAARFHNALRVLTSIEVLDLRTAGVIDENWGTPEASGRNQIEAFIRAPFDEALRMPDREAATASGRSLCRSRQRPARPARTLRADQRRRKRHRAGIPHRARRASQSRGPVMSRFLAFRALWAGTVQDVCAGLAMLSFLLTAGFWIVVLS